MKTGVLTLLFVVGTLVGCGGEQAPDQAATTSGVPLVMTTFYPTTYFARRIGGDFVRVVCPVPADADPIFWEPSADDVTAYQKADLIVVNGAEYEKWVDKVSLPYDRIVDTSKAFDADLLRFRSAIVHSHGPAGKHSHTGIDGHTWMDPVQAKMQAAAIRDALKALLPAHAADFDRSCAALDADLDALDASLKDAVKTYGGQTIFASHPAYNYLARRYGLKVVNLALDPQEMPTDAEFADIRKKLEATPSVTILWESDPKPEIAERFQRELGLTSITFSPCETMDPAEEKAGKNYLTVMKADIEALKPALAAKAE